MVIFITFFRTADLKERVDIKGKYFAHVQRVFPDFEAQLQTGAACVGYFAGRDNASVPAVWLKLQAIRTGDDQLTLQFGGRKTRDIFSGDVRDGVARIAQHRGWVKADEMPPVVCFLSDEDAAAVCDGAKELAALEALMDSGDYKGVCMRYAPLGKLSDNAVVWNNPDILYQLGRACSRLATTLLIKAGETKKLKIAAQYRQQCETIFLRGAELESDNARFPTALAYRYYSNVHELMRPGERRDQSLDEQIELANEWLSRALEIYQGSVRNNYRKGKLIIAKQVPYLLYGKKAFGAKEAAILREIRSVGEEHLGSAIALYEAMDEGPKKEANRREYAKALFVLASFYLDDAALPLHEFFLRRIAGDTQKVSIRPIDKLNVDAADEMLQKCFAAETDMPLDGMLDIAALADAEKSWTRAPADKLYRLGCARVDKAFIALCEGENPHADAAEAIRRLNAAKAAADNTHGRKRNTWHLSERIAWAHICLGAYGKAASLLSRARSGYIINTYAIARLLSGKERDVASADDALARAAADKHNLAAGLTHVLYAYTRKRLGQQVNLEGVSLSAKNMRLATILGVAPVSKQR